MPLLTSLGLIPLALAGLSGWLVLLATERPEWLRARHRRARAHLPGPPRLPAWGPGAKGNPLCVAVTLASFTATSGGLTAVAVHALA